MSAVVLLLAVAGAHYAYYWWPQQSGGRPWAAYVGTHALIFIALLMHLPGAARRRWAPLWVFACWWGAIESLQASTCAVLAWGSTSQSDLCVQVLGSATYPAAAAMALATLIVMRWRHG